MKKLNEIEELIVHSLKTTGLGLEAMLPTDALLSDGRMGLVTLLEKGVIEKIEHSELCRVCPGTRYGLVGEKYPKTFVELLEYREYRESDPSLGLKTFSEYLKLTN